VNGIILIFIKHYTGYTLYSLLGVY